MLPEDREVTDIMTQRKVSFLHVYSLIIYSFLFFRQQLCIFMHQMNLINGINILDI
jgi:hypothetical protein